MSWSEASITYWAGMSGTALVIIAYMPQIAHLVMGRCAAGVSIPAYVVWTVASFLILVHAIGIQANVFIVLGGYQLVACILIAVFAWIYKDGRCPQHQ